MLPRDRSRPPDPGCRVARQSIRSSTPTTPAFDELELDWHWDQSILDELAGIATSKRSASALHCAASTGPICSRCTTPTHWPTQIAEVRRARPDPPASRIRLGRVPETGRPQPAGAPILRLRLPARRTF